MRKLAVTMSPSSVEQSAVSIVTIVCYWLGLGSRLYAPIIADCAHITYTALEL